LWEMHCREGATGKNFEALFKKVVVTDRDFSAENQDNAADPGVQRAVLAGNGKLTAEMFEAAGVPVSDTAAATAPAPRLVRHQPSKIEIVRLGEEAMTRQGQSWEDWIKVMHALDTARSTAMLEANSNKPEGPRYREAYRKWLRFHPVFESIDKSDRSRFHKCFDNLDAINTWRKNHMPPQRLLKLNYPPTVLSHWEGWKRKSAGSIGENGPASNTGPTGKAPKPELTTVMAGMTDDELSKELPVALPFDRFLRILSQDWRAEIESRLSKRPYAETAAAFIRASEMLRRAISLVKIADAPKTTPVVAASNEKEALAALRQLNVVLAGAGIDAVTIVHQHAKEPRCVKDRQGARGRRRRSASGRSSPRSWPRSG